MRSSRIALATAIALALFAPQAVAEEVEETSTQIVEEPVAPAESEAPTAVPAAEGTEAPEVEATADSHRIELGPVGRDEQGRPGRIHVVVRRRHPLGHLRRLPRYALGVAVHLAGESGNRESPPDLSRRPDLDHCHGNAQGQRRGGRAAAVVGSRSPRRRFPPRWRMRLSATPPRPDRPIASRRSRPPASSPWMSSKVRPRSSTATSRKSG